MNQSLTFEMLDSRLGDNAPFLISLSDGLQEELRIVISGATVGKMGDNLPDFKDMDAATEQALGEILERTRPIEVNEQHFYEILFRDYILYQIRNESFGSYAPDEVGHGRYLMTFEKSRFLSYLPVATDAQMLDDGSYYPGKWVHYGIYTQNHVIDVIAHGVPELSEVRKDCLPCD